MIPKITIIVLNWNGHNDTIDCLNSLQKVIDDNFEILLVDNGSKIHPIDEIEIKFPNINYLKLDNNYGYSGGNNRGFDYIKNNTDYVCFLNNDVIVDMNFLNNLRCGLDEFGGINIFGPKIYFEYPSNKIWFGGGIVNLKQGQIYHQKIGYLDSAEQSQMGFTDYITGCCLLLSVGSFIKLNGFNEQFNMYAEDVDLCLRAKKENINCIYVPKAKIWHKVSSSTGGRYSVKKYLKKMKSIRKLIQIHEPDINPTLTMIKSFITLIFKIKIK
jgi:GT2 family glycosyltransferase